jgi:hypothetical protein
MDGWMDGRIGGWMIGWWDEMHAYTDTFGFLFFVRDIRRI